MFNRKKEILEQSPPSQFRIEVKETAETMAGKLMGLVDKSKEFQMASLVLPQLKTLPHQLAAFSDNYTDEELYTFLCNAGEVITWLKAQYKLN